MFNFKPNSEPEPVPEPYLNLNPNPFSRIPDHVFDLERYPDWDSCELKVPSPFPQPQRITSHPISPLFQRGGVFAPEPEPEPEPVLIPIPIPITVSDLNPLAKPFIPKSRTLIPSVTYDFGTPQRQYSACFEFFDDTNRTQEPELILTRFINAWNENPTNAVKILLHFRDIRHGRGEKFISRIILFYIKLMDGFLYSQLVKYMINNRIGTWKDLLYIVELGTHYGLVEPELNSTELELFENQLNLDMQTTIYHPRNPISMCAKWTPSENGHYNKKGIRFANKLMKRIGISPKEYRKGLSRMRTKLNLTEKNMSMETYDKIEFSKVPSTAHSIYGNAFARKTNDQNRKINLTDRYSEYLVKNYKSSSDNDNAEPPKIIRSYSEVLTNKNFQPEHRQQSLVKHYSLTYIRLHLLKTAIVSSEFGGKTA